jgi:putative tricarboxylic transport membrane protein
MAVLLGGFVIHGIQPGPLLIVREPQLFWGIICSMYIGNIMLVLLNVPLVGVWIKLLNVPFNVLFPLILIFCVLGVYTINNNPYEIVVMIGFGVFGYLARKFDYEGAPFLLGMVLGPMFETAYRQSLGYGGQMSVFFRRPISAILIGASLLLLMTSILPKIRHRRKELVEKLE